VIIVTGVSRAAKITSPAAIAHQQFTVMTSSARTANHQLRRYRHGWTRLHRDVCPAGWQTTKGGLRSNSIAPTASPVAGRVRRAKTANGQEPGDRGRCRLMHKLIVLSC
jgi:hypothetical protein